MSIWKDKSGLHQPVGGPSIIEEKISRLGELNQEYLFASSWPLKESIMDDIHTLVRELDDLGVQVSVNRRYPNLLEYDL